MQRNTPQLRLIVNEFVHNHKLGTAHGNTIAKKYLGNIDWVKAATDEQGLDRFKSLITLFREAGKRYHLPAILPAAQGYKESGLNQNLRSPAGAVGIMQIKAQTAASSPIFITDIEKPGPNIEAGAEYLRYIITQYYANERMDPVMKGLFALASYNAGANRIQQPRRKAAAAGYDPNRWFNNVELVVAKEIGIQTVQYVGNIFKYYLAYKLVLEQDARRQTAFPVPTASDNETSYPSTRRK